MALVGLERAQDIVCFLLRLGSCSALNHILLRPVLTPFAVVLSKSREAVEFLQRRDP
jgi:hypothetical protein